MTSAEKPASDRYQFGSIGLSFIDKSYSAECREAAYKLLSFPGKENGD